MTCFVLAAGLACAALALAAVLIAPSGPQANAADAETAALIQYFNQYRAEQGVGPLSTSSTLNANTQTATDETASSCSYQIPDGPGLKFATTAYPTAAMVWEAWQKDPGYLPWIRDPKYHTVGVGRSASDCSFGHIWWVILSTDGAVTTPQPTSTSTLPPSPTPIPDIGGDIDCSGDVTLFDGLEVLKVIGGANAHAPCITASGPDCTGFLTANDALVLFLYVGGLPADLPDGCPAIGSVTTPAPGPSPSVTPTPAPTPAGTPDPGAAMDHCWLAPVIYDMTYHWLLEGDFPCAPANGAAYTCNFPAGSNAIECATDTLAHYSCYVWSDPGIDVPCVSSLSTDEDYLCNQNETSITCSAETSPTYVCTVEDQLVTCTGPATFAWSPPTPN